MKHLIIAIILSSTVGSMTVTLNNGSIIEGNFKKLKRNEIYLENYRTLFIINYGVIESVVLNDESIDKEAIVQIPTGRINFNSYDQFIEIDQDNVNSSEVSALIGSCLPQYEYPIKPILKHIDERHYLATKPIRLFAKWYDITYGYRIPAKSTEIRTSISYASDIPYHTSVGMYMVFSKIKLLTYATTYRWYIKDNCRGFYFGSGLGGSIIRIYDIGSIFLFISYDPVMTITTYYGGPVFETGYTGYFNNKVYSSINLGAVFGIAGSKDSHIKRNIAFRITPFITYSLGYVF